VGRSKIIVKAIGINAPPPSPCKARYADNSMIESAIPHKILPIMKMSIPKRKKRFLPYMSLNLPKIGIPATVAIM